MAALEPSVETIQNYYGKVLGGSADLKTNACCATGRVPEHLRPLLAEIQPDVLEHFYGCGAPIPPALERCTVLDLGCGSGRDAFLASRLVGPGGRVIGIDVTPEQLAIARANLSDQMSRYGYSEPNVEFREGRIEDLAAAGVENSSVDVIISDCVINLSLDKSRVFREAFRVLKPGGELHFADVFADRRLPTHLMQDPELHGECLAGAMYFEDFRRLLGEMGCPDVRTLARSDISIQNESVERKIGMARFESVTIRAFKLTDLEDRCEDYGQVATYLGTIPSYPHRFTLDDHHVFETDRPERVCGNTASMLADTRFAPHFRVTGDRSKHFGLFPCGARGATETTEVGSSSCC